MAIAQILRTSGISYAGNVSLVGSALKRLPVGVFDVADAEDWKRGQHIIYLLQEFDVPLCYRFSRVGEDEDEAPYSFALHNAFVALDRDYAHLPAHKFQSSRTEAQFSDASTYLAQEERGMDVERLAAAANVVYDGDADTAYEQTAHLNGGLEKRLYNEEQAALEAFDVL